LDWVLSWSSA
jgi:hypothetical protein